MSSTSTISTPLPKDLSPETLLKSLHDHDLYFKLSDKDLISFTKSSGDSPPTVGAPCKYAIVSKQHTADHELTNQPDGLDSLSTIKSAVGNLVVRTKFRVADGVLKEDIEIEANFLIRKMAKGPTEKNEAELHKRYFDDIAKA